MGYYIRAFCASDKIPALKEILEWARAQGYELQIDPSFKDDLNSDKWEQAGIIYKNGKQPFLAEINTDNGSDDCLMKDEINEFKEFLAEIKGLFNFNKKKVLKHLNATKYIVATQIPINDFDIGNIKVRCYGF